MDDVRLGGLFRAARIRRGWRQADLAARCSLSDQTISRIERGQLAGCTLATTRSVAKVLQVDLDLVARWRGGEGARLLSWRHSALSESVARTLSDDGWLLKPEVSFAVYGERGVIDLVAWHPRHRALLVIELKTEIIDVGELLATFDRKRRLAPRIARERGLDPAQIGAALIVAESAMNRSRVAAHGQTMRAALPADGRRLRAWLRDPSGPIAAIAFWANPRGTRTNRDWSPTRRVRVSRRGSSAARTVSVERPLQAAGSPVSRPELDSSGTAG